MTKELWKKACLGHKPEESLGDHRDTMKLHHKDELSRQRSLNYTVSALQKCTEMYRIYRNYIKLHCICFIEMQFKKQIQPIRWPKSTANRKLVVVYLKMQNTISKITIFSLGGKTSYIDGEIIYFFQFYLYILLYNIVLVLPYINMNLPWVYMCSPS